MNGLKLVSEQPNDEREIFRSFHPWRNNLNEFGERNIRKANLIIHSFLTLTQQGFCCSHAAGYSFFLKLLHDEEMVFSAKHVRFESVWWTFCFVSWICLCRSIFICMTFRQPDFHFSSFTLNPFYATSLFLYPLKTLENLRFSDVFRGV